MYRINSFLVLCIVIAGCHTSSSDPEYASHANMGLAAQEGVTSETPTGTEMKKRLLRLWSDREEYTLIILRERGSEQLPRLVSSVPAEYPMIPYIGNVKARVTVSFVVSASGTVEESRVYESSDARFDESALNAVRQWKFLPALIDGKPTKEMITIPIEFGGRK